MSARRHRAEQAMRLAAEAEQTARAQWAEAERRVQADDLARETTLARSSELAKEELSPGLQAHLISSGARHLTALAEEKEAHTVEAGERRDELDEARVRLRSLERLVERLDATERLRRRQAAEAVQRDLIASRATRRSS